MGFTLPGSSRTWTFAATVVLGVPAWAQLTHRVSVASTGAQGNSNSGFYGVTVSADGRYAVFESEATNLVPGDTNVSFDVFVRDRLLGTTERVSVDSAGSQGNSPSFRPSISADARFVAFESYATNLVPGDTNNCEDIFVRDRLLGTTERVSVDSAGSQAIAVSWIPSISADGRFVAFTSYADNLVAGDTNGERDVFVRDRSSGTTERVSVDSSGAEGNDRSGYFGSSISSDGRYVAFESFATNLVPGDTNGWEDVFVRDRLSGTTELVSLGAAGTQADAASSLPSISAHGRFVAFQSDATNLVAGDTNGTGDVFVRDRLSGTTVLVSTDSVGALGNSDSTFPSISADGRCVAFASAATNLVAGDTNASWDMFVRDLGNGTTERVSVGSTGSQGHEGADPFGNFASSWISADGRYVAFSSSSANLVAHDTNAFADVFVRDRSYSTFTSLCEPGVGGALACPCSNPPAGPGRGCDNSAGTGGASFTASGAALLSEDSLVFSAELETPSALSIVMQGNAGIPTGVVYGQGIRCVGGTIVRRLYVKSAFYGSITAPESALGEPPVTVRSAEKGDVIRPAESRWYLVYYRDPVVRGGCPPSSTFNATQTGQVAWLP